MGKVTLADRGEFLVRPYQPEDEKYVLSLWKTAFQKEMPETVWRWKYTENPFGFHMLLCLNESGIPVVMYGGIPYRANWNGTPVEITNLMDIMSHPDYRKTGLFIHTGNAFFDRFGGPEKSVFLYGFPGSYHYEIGRKYLGYRKLAADVVYLHAAVDALIQSGFQKSTGCIEQNLIIDDAFDRLWQRCRGSYPLAIIRDAAFLSWRYAHHPVKSYEVWQYRVSRQGDMMAYAIFSIEAGTAVISDVMAPLSDIRLSDFWSVLGKMLYDRGVVSVATWLPGGHFMVQSAVSSGFSVCPEPTGIIPTLRIFDPDMDFAWACDHLFYTMADGDLV